MVFTIPRVLRAPAVFGPPQKKDGSKFLLTKNITIVQKLGVFSRVPKTSSNEQEKTVRNRQKLGVFLHVLKTRVILLTKIIAKRQKLGVFYRSTNLNN